MGVCAFLLAVLLAVAAIANGTGRAGLEIAYTKNRQFWRSENTDRTIWNSHSFVVVQKPGRWEPFLWGGGKLWNRAERVNAAWMVIDGEAGTPITEWNGDPATLDWVRHDVTTLPVLPAAGVGRGDRVWRRARSARGHLGRQPGDHRDRRQRHDDRPADRQPSHIRADCRPPGGPPGARRRPVIPDAQRGSLRRHPDVADRHLGLDRRRRIQPLRERPLHHRGVGRGALAARRRPASSACRAGSRPATSPKQTACSRSAPPPCWRAASTTRRRTCC